MFPTTQPKEGRFSEGQTMAVFIGSSLGPGIRLNVPTGQWVKGATKVYRRNILVNPICPNRERG